MLTSPLSSFFFPLDRSQREREAALGSFRSGETPIMVATAVAARGLDIPNVTHVINYDIPNDIDDYVHRIGRTGRAGNTGKSTAFFNISNKGVARELVDILQEANQTVPEWLEKIANQVSYEKSGGFRGGRGRGRGGYGRQNDRFTDFRRGGGGGFGGGSGGSSRSAGGGYRRGNDGGGGFGGDPRDRSNW